MPVIHSTRLRLAEVAQHLGSHGCRPCLPAWEFQCHPGNHADLRTIIGLLLPVVPVDSRYSESNRTWTVPRIGGPRWVARTSQIEAVTGESLRPLISLVPRAFGPTRSGNCGFGSADCGLKKRLGNTTVGRGNRKMQLGKTSFSSCLRARRQTASQRGPPGTSACQRYEPFSDTW